MDKNQHDDFEGYSPNEMHLLLYWLYERGCPVQLKPLEAKDCGLSPLFRQVNYLIETLQQEGKLKLTATGKLPPKLVKELYPLGYPEYTIEKGISKLSKETDSESVQLVHILLKLSRIVKEQKQVMTLTKNGQKITLDDNQLIQELMLSFSLKYNLAYLDAFQSETIGGLGIGYTLLLLSKYGETWRTHLFYAEKYFKAFPFLLEDCHSPYRSPLEVGASCYSSRVFLRFLLKMGLIDYSSRWEQYTEIIQIKKTPLFDNWISVTAPGRPSDPTSGE